MDCVKLQFPDKPRCSLLQDALVEVLKEDRFKDMTNAEVIGTLEYLKWNLINRSD